MRRRKVLSSEKTSVSSDPLLDAHKKLHRDSKTKGLHNNNDELGAVAISKNDDGNHEAALSSLDALSNRSMLLASAPLMAAAVACQHPWATHNWGVPKALSSSLLEGCIRTLIQLTLLVTVLQPIFNNTSLTRPFLVMGYALFMVVLAAYEISSGTTYQFHGQFLFVFASLAFNVVWVAVWAFWVVLAQKPHQTGKPLWTNPRYVIPIVGMLLGNSMSAASLSLNSITTALVEDRAEVNLWLSFGATTSEATQRLVRRAIDTGMTPILHMMRVVGVMSLPGMMTGNLLGGSSALTAARYQIFIIFMIAACVLGVVLTNTFGALQLIGFDPHHGCLLTTRLYKNQQPTITESVVDAWEILGSPWGNKLEEGLITTHNSIDEIPWDETKQPLRLRQLIHNPTSEGDGKSVHLNVQGVSKSFILLSQNKSNNSSSAATSTPGTSRIIFQNVSLLIRPGDLWLLQGSSGSGKSTLLRSLARLLPLDSGNLSLGNIAWSGSANSKPSPAPTRNLTWWRKQVRYVAQTKVDIPGTPQKMMEDLSQLGSWRLSSKQTEQFTLHVHQYLESWGMPEPGNALATKEWSQLSGGEAQRIITAIALASRPLFVLFDESTSSLDQSSKQAVEASVKKYVREGNGGVVWISHDEEQADRMVVLE